MDLYVRRRGIHDPHHPADAARAAVICFSPTDADRLQLLRLLDGVDREALQDDGTNYDGVTIVKPWGSEHQLRYTSEFCIWHLEINEGHETSMHCHWRKTAVMEVQRRHVVLRLLGSEHILLAGQCALIEPGVFHQTAAPVGALVSELEFPPNKQDLLRLRDRYGREGKGYERCS